MFSEHFYLNRKKDIDERLMFIEKCDVDVVITLMQVTWDGRPESKLFILLLAYDSGFVCANCFCVAYTLKHQPVIL